MGRFLFIIGLIMTLVGFVGPFFSLGGLFGDMDSMMDLALDNDAREAELCEEGETLEEELGASTYTQGSGYGRTASYYCVDEDGNRRNVTLDFLDSMFGDDFFGSLGGSIGQTFLFVGLATIGIFFMVIGGIMNMMGKRKNMMMVMNPYNASMPVNQPPMQPMQTMNQNAWGTPAQTPQQGGLAAQLQELESAYKQNLISREEYDKARANLLNNIK